MLRPDGRLPFRDLAWSDSRIAEIVDREVLPVLRPGSRVREVKREHTSYKPGKYSLAVYSVGIEDTEAPLRLTLTFAAGGRSAKLRQRHYADPDDLRAVALPGHSCLVELFPADWKLPDLAAACDPSRVGELLEASAPRLAVSEVTLVQHRPQRRGVLRYRVDEANGERPAELVAKVYPYAERAERVRGRLRSLRSSARDRGLRLPSELGAARASGLVLMERVPGENLGELLRETASREEASRLAEIAAHALATFHGLKCDGEAAWRVGDEIGRVRALATSMVEVAPQVAARVQACLNVIDARLERRPHAAPRLIHGDYKPSQLLVHDDGPALLDLDRACLGDPAVDLGNVLAVFDTKALLWSKPHLRELGDAFLSAYRGESGITVDEETVRLVQPLALLRMLLRGIESEPDRYLRGGADWSLLAFLDEAEAGLELVGR